MNVGMVVLVPGGGLTVVVTMTVEGVVVPEAGSVIQGCETGSGCPAARLIDSRMPTPAGLATRMASSTIGSTGPGGLGGGSGGLIGSATSSTLTKPDGLAWVDGRRW